MSSTLGIENATRSRSERGRSYFDTATGVIYYELSLTDSPEWNESIRDIKDVASRASNVISLRHSPDAHYDTTISESYSFTNGVMHCKPCSIHNAICSPARNSPSGWGPYPH